MKTPAWRLWFLSGVTALSLGGDCNPMNTGQLGNAEFIPVLQHCLPENFFQYAGTVYASGGVDGDINVKMVTHGCSQATYQTVRSTHPEVATVTASAAGVHLQTEIPGTTELQLLDDSGQVVDATDITVHAIDKYQMVYDAMLEGVLLENVPAIAAYFPVDNLHMPLVDTHVPQTSASGTLTMLPREQQTCTGIKFLGQVGMGALHVSDGTLSSQMDVEVVGVARVTSIDTIVGAVSQSSVNVKAIPRVADGRIVYGAYCQWSSKDPGVTLHSATPDPLVVDLLDFGSSAEFQLSHAGSFVVTCTIGSVSVDATITKY